LKANNELPKEARFLVFQPKISNGKNEGSIEEQQKK
jgi:hypothetical protein